MKRPSFQFYPSDWLSASDVRACSMGARGLWMDMICLMHQGEPYGYLTLNGKGILPATLARIVGASLAEVEGWLEELESLAVFSRTEDGTILCRRMIRDEEIRQSRASGGFKSTLHPNVPKSKKSEGYPSTDPSRVPLGVSFGVSPSSSSSSSSSSSEEDTVTNVTASKGKKKQPKPAQENSNPQDRRDGSSGERCPLYQVFLAAYQTRYEPPYASKSADFIQLAKLKKNCVANNWELTTERWERSVRNYFQSPLSAHTLADLSVRFSTFFKSPLDQYGKPLMELAEAHRDVNGNGDGKVVIPMPPKPANWEQMSLGEQRRWTMENYQKAKQQGLVA